MPARDDESGVPVYPRVKVPARKGGDRGHGDRSRGDWGRSDRRGGGSVNRRLIGVVAGLMIAGGAGGWLLRPVISPDPQLAGANKRVEEAVQAATEQKGRAEALEKSLDAATKGKRDVDAKLTAAEAAQRELAEKIAGETERRKAAEAMQGKLKGVVDRTVGTVTIEGGEVHVRIADRALFKAGDDALIDRGKAMLGKIAGVLKEVTDRGVWVQGHTDELASDAKAAAKAAAAKGPAAKRARPGPAAGSARFASNWELSAARALTVVHYLQDAGKLDPARLAALAFGAQAPISTDRAANRRIEIVVMPLRAPAK
jgi:chemotaxis protein MotB